MAAEGVVSPVSVVVLEPVVQGCGALVVAGVGVSVGPLGLQGAVEALDAPMFVKPRR